MATATDVYLGIDGGSFATRAAVVDADGRLLASCQERGLTHPMARTGPRQLRERFQDVAGAVPPHARVASVFAGLTGVDRAEDEAASIALVILREIWPSATVVVDSDGVAAWAGATGARPGVAAMAGTGSVVIAVDDEGGRARTSGWGPLLGDDAGGWGIGVSAIRAMLRRWERGTPASALDIELLAALKARSPGDVPGRVTSGRISRLEVSDLARVVARWASRDQDARHILGIAARALAEDTVRAIDALRWSSVPVTIVPIGNAVRTGPAYLEPLKRAVKRLASVPVRFDEPVLSSLGGAVLLALRQAGLDPASRLDRLASTAILEWRTD